MYNVRAALPPTDTYSFSPRFTKSIFDEWMSDAPEYNAMSFCRHLRHLITLTLHLSPYWQLLTGPLTKCEWCGAKMQLLTFLSSLSCKRLRFRKRMVKKQSTLLKAWESVLLDNGCIFKPDFYAHRKQDASCLNIQLLVTLSGNTTHVYMRFYNVIWMIFVKTSEVMRS